MPAADPSRSGPSTAVRAATIVAGMLGGVMVALLVVRLVGGKRDEERPAERREFDVGPAEARARSIARDGPLLFQDPLGRGRDVYVQHLGDGRWLAFAARAPQAPARCVLVWRQAEAHFVDPCTSASYPPDGAGLVQYPARVDKDERVQVDLGSPRGP